MSESELHQLRELMAQRPDDAAVRRRLGSILQASGDILGAEAAYRDSLRLEPESVRAHNNLGQVLLAQKDRAGAMACYERAILLDTRYAIAHNNLGIVHFDEGRYEAAVRCYRRALECQPALSQAHHNCGQALVRLRRLDEALIHFNQALAAAPNDIHTLQVKAGVLQNLERFDEALQTYDRLLSIAPNRAEVLSNSASTLLSLKRADEALQRSVRALELNPEFPEAHSNRAGALRALNLLPEALDACERALQIKPDFALAWVNLANVMIAMGRFQDALDCCDKALALHPDLIEAYEQRALALPRQKRIDDAIRAYEILRKLKPEHPYVLGALQNVRNIACDWRYYAQSCSDIERAVGHGERAVAPFIFVNLNGSPALQLECARAFVSKELPLHIWAQPLPAYGAHEKLRVAYLSADFHHHATAMLVAGVFENHDRGRFEIIGVSFGPDDESALRQRLRNAFDSFIDVREKSDEQVVELLRGLEVDIAVDLKGYTADMRPAIFARRCAPVQVSFLGYPGTLGLPQMDYIIADTVVLPPEHAVHYVEKVAWLPDSYQANDDNRKIAQGMPTRQQAGLPESGFVYCCFNNNHKITPLMFDIWMRVLGSVPGSVLWLLGDNDAAVRNLRIEAQKRAVEPERLIFAPRMDIADHLARHRLADLFLDTLPYNAHTTASDALWAGVPVLTCLGNAFAGRVAASLLHAVGLPELVVKDLAEYEARALTLARGPTLLASLRSTLIRNRLTQPLFDTRRFTRHLESAYLAMWQRNRDGLPPESFQVERRGVRMTAE